MERVIDFWRWFVTILHESNFKKLRQEIDKLGIYDLHNILSQQKKVEWCEWHLNIDENDHAIKIVDEFRKNFKHLKLSSSIIDQVDTIGETFLNFMPKDFHWNTIRDYFRVAREQDSPVAIIRAYTYSKNFSQHLNKHSAVNTYHALKLYCTLLNCPILAQTQEYTEAFTRILFHPKLIQYLVRQETVYRGIVLEDKKLIDNYNEGATIITTTFLSTSTNPDVANCFSDPGPQNAISVFCIYNINNINRHTALDLRNLSVYQNEDEILILRYVPFIIKSIERMDDGRRMTICFDECKEQHIVEENLF
ncbi:unnamed protein product [Adineta steineri]|uniref:ADP ribosyltransferase domain-containing protein n=1 Tax=Adineta steineri TaxID=433720 RepID=A0A819UJD2_9BILA|nr:unnamed protein product [Adineta steineri]CAF4096149.1 unnamed protein product [Adineta steineri]